MIETGGTWILHSWSSLVFWLYKVRPEMKPGHGVALINRLMNALVEKRTDVFIDDILEPEEDLKFVIAEFMKVVQDHPEFVSYWAVQGKKDERVREYNHRVRTVTRDELRDLLDKEIKVPMRGGRIFWN